MANLVADCTRTLLWDHVANLVVAGLLSLAPCGRSSSTPCGCVVLAPCGRPCSSRSAVLRNHVANLVANCAATLLRNHMANLVAEGLLLRFHVANLVAAGLGPRFADPLRAADLFRAALARPNASCSTWSAGTARTLCGNRLGVVAACNRKHHTSRCLARGQLAGVRRARNFVGFRFPVTGRNLDRLGVVSPAP